MKRSCKFNNIQLKYYTSVIIAIFFLASCSIQTKQTDDKDSNPNIIFILADDLGYGDISCLNADSKISTPNIDHLSSQGVTFTDAHSGSAVCTPTRYGVLTGRYCWRTRLKKSVLWPWDTPLIEADRLTVGEMLRQKGYSTACIGKWHLGWEWQTSDGSHMSDSDATDRSNGQKFRNDFSEKVDFSASIKNGPVTRGFDYYFGDDVPNFPPYCFIENDRTLGIPDRQKPNNMFGHKGPMSEGWKLENVMPALTQKAVDYIKNTDEKFKRKKDAPFFLYFTLTAPHTPIAPAKNFQGTSNAGAYGDFVQEVDWTVGQIMSALKKEGLQENTLVIFTSDNGSPGRDGTNMAGATQSVTQYGHFPSFHFRGIKADIYEGGHRVPFFAHWPAQIKPASSCNETICLTDFMATCSAIVKTSLPNDAAEDSYNLLPLLKGEEHQNPLREATVHHSGNGQFAIRQGKWKLILGGGSGGWSRPLDDTAAEKEGLPLIQLYDMGKDVSETTNVFNQYPHIVDKLKKLLESYKLEGRSTPLRN